MNSDFVQLEAEALAKRVAAEPDNRARIRKIYTLTYGRLPTEQEIQIGLNYLHTEPLKEYEEDKNKADEKKKSKASEGMPGAPLAKMAAPATEVADTPAPDEAAAPATEGDAPPEAAMGMGMMAGMGGPGGRRGQAPAKAEVKYEPTVWGRYAKVLLSSSEFIFIN